MQSDEDGRTCAACGKPLPASASPRRLYCPNRGACKQRAHRRLVAEQEQHARDVDELLSEADAVCAEGNAAAALILLDELRAALRPGGAK